MLETIYQKLPVPFQSLALNAFAFKLHRQRFGESFRETMAFLDKSQWFSEEELVEYQNRRLQNLVKHAYDTVPFYRRRMDECSLKPADIRTREDLRRFPVLTRDDVRHNWKDMISKAYRRSDLVLGHTSGTTGSPLEFFWDKELCVFNNAVDWRQKKWAGLTLGEPYAVLLGRVVVPIHWRKPPFWRTNHIQNQLWMSVFHMSGENLGLYVDKLRKFRPKLIEGYPSSVYILARYLKSIKEDLPLTAVLTSSETLFDFQKEVIEEVFSCRIFDFYGMAERVIFASECEHHEGKHINSEYGITEILDNGRNPVGKQQIGRLVGTSLHNYGMPFIRYETSDVSAFLEEKCSCGRNLPLMKDVTTKAEDIVVTRDGRLVSPSALTHPFKPLHGVEMSQIVQDDVDRILVKIVKGRDFDNSQVEGLLKSLKERLGEETNVEIEFVESIPKTAAGKYRWVVSRVPLPL